jgi:hypothetical protein
MLMAAHPIIVAALTLDSGLAIAGIVIAAALAILFEHNRKKDVKADLEASRSAQRDSRRQIAGLEAKNERIANELTDNRKEIAHLRQSNDSLAKGNRELIAKLMAHMPVWVGLPTGRATGFVGRKREFDLARAALQDHGKVVLYGLPGSGKTELAIKLARESTLRHGVMWAGLGSTPSPELHLKKWWRALSAEATIDESVDITDQLANTLAQRSTLLVLDDVWAVDDMNSLLLEGRDGAVLVTTHNRTVADQFHAAHPDALTISLDDLDPADSLEVLKEAAGIAEAAAVRSGEADDFLKTLCEQAGNFPFALVVLGGYINAHISLDQSPSVADLEKIIQPLGTMLLDLTNQVVDPWGHPTYRWDVVSLRSLIGQLIEPGTETDTLTPELRTALKSLSVLRPKPGAFSLHQAMAIVDRQADAVKDELEELVRHGLVELAGREKEEELLTDSPDDAEDHVNEERYQMHLLVSEFCLTSLRQDDPATYSELRNRALRYFEDAVEPSEDDVAVSGQASWLRAHRVETTRWNRDAASWLYQLSEQTDRYRARQSFDRVFFELFWWWNLYMPDDRIGVLLEEWQRMTPSEVLLGEKSWFDSIVSFSDAYLPAQRPWREGDLPAIPDFGVQNWNAIQEALKVIRLDIMDRNEGSHSVLHTRAITDIFLAQACRYLRPGDDAADALYDQASELFGQCGDNCSWNVPWIEYERSDMWLTRREWDRAVAQAETAIRGAFEETGENVAEVLLDLRSLDYEILSNCLRVRAECMWRKGDSRRALRDYEGACLLSYVFQFWPHQPDSYTIAFYGEMIARTLRMIEEWYASAPGEATDAVQDLVEFGQGAYGLGADMPEDLSGLASAGRQRKLMELAFAPRPVEGQYPGLALFATVDHKDRQLPSAIDQALRRELTRLAAELNYA